MSPKLHGRHAGCLAGHQIGRPKPYAQRRVRARHDRSHRQSGVTAALAAAQDARTICEAERLSRRLTMGANEPVAPASLLQVAGTGRIVREKSLELWQRLWEPKIATLVNVHEHGRTLPLVAVGDNRIGKQSLTTMEKSSPLTPKSQPRWGHYPILPSPITRGNAASTNTLTASSGSTSQKVPTSLFCPMPMSKGSRTNSTLAPERYSATKPLARFSSAPEICPLHFTVEWAFSIIEQFGA